MFNHPASVCNHPIISVLHLITLTTLVTCTHTHTHTHTLLRYDPERFAAPREEDKVKPFSFIGFGGGRHGCLGSNFAYLQVGGPSGGE